MKRILIGKRNRLKNRLFNPYENGISSYDLAYLSSNIMVKKKISSKYTNFPYKEDLVA